MAHNIDQSNGRDNIAFLGSRNDVWHKMGQEMKPGMSIEEWAKAAGLDWQALKMPAYAMTPKGEYIEKDGNCFLVRSDTQRPLGYVSNGYATVQPRDVLKWFRDYIMVDDRFQLDVAGSLKGGAIVWATATFNGEMKVAGDTHRARVLMTTTFDGTGSTTNQATMTRVVCDNTLKVATSDKRAVVRTTHRGAFQPKRVAKELADIASSFDTYKAMGEAMAIAQMSLVDTSNFFKAILDIPFDAKQDDISTRKLHQFKHLNQAYTATVAEGTERGTAWTALNAVTRYVDHDRSVKGHGVDGTSEAVARFLSANFAAGDTMKNKAVALLGNHIGAPQGVALPASMAAAL